ncbi:MAG TPA: cobalamin-binding protein [Bacillota bacterium]|jgi:iron complex transport system substrate-binding protein|nr:cobalamin-binding protein [Bacillota bacterium]HQE66229.1 cobalamin-binding protein [Bacillota bacterium]HQJ37468.1 cobalamin-binding protein [Bacillota bacterium]
MKKLIILLIACITILGLFGCADSRQNKEFEDTAIIEVTDIKGRSIALDKIPQRIVSLSPSTTEILFALGAGDRVVGATNYCDYPEEAKKVEKIGDYDEPNMELIRKVQPDVVLAGHVKEETAEALEKMGIPVIITEAEDFDTIYHSIKLVGQVTGTAAEAEAIVNGMKSKIAEIQTKYKDKEKPRVFYLVWKDPLFTAGSKTFINDVIKAAGGINVAEKVEGWANYSAEEMIKDNPDMLIAALHSTDEGMTKEDLSGDRLFSLLECVKQGKVHIMPDDNIISRPGPRIVQAIEDMSKVLHGE